MGFTEVLTIIFILLKVFNVVSWSWWIVFLPEIIAGVLYLLIIVIQIVGICKTNKKVTKKFDDLW